MTTQKTFSELNLSENVMKALEKKGFTIPSPIQEMVIPEFLKEKSNIIGQAKTGTGKTLAFGIPIIESIVPNGKIQAIILAPTRELALQVNEEIFSLLTFTNLRCTTVYGGAPIDQQIRTIKRGVDILVGTPGRVIDLIDRNVIKLGDLQFFVLDEADEMLNMGFVEDIEKILLSTNPDKSMLFFSATMPRSILDIAKRYMKEFKTIKVANATTNDTSELVKQIYFEVSSRDKLTSLCRVLDAETDFYGIVFGKTRVEVDDITKELKSLGYRVDALHGDINQAQRIKILDDFKNKRITILVATDVASRGIDVNDLTHVINYSIPNQIDSYVHRIGRTGRAGRKGIAITFVAKPDLSQLMQIKRVTKADIEKRQVPTIDEIITAKEKHLFKQVNEKIVTSDYEDYLHLANALLANEAPNEIIVASLLRHVYEDKFIHESYNQIKEINTNNSSDVKIFFAMGKMDDLNPKKLLDKMFYDAKIKSHKIRNLKLYDKFSFFNTDLEEAEKIMHFYNKNRTIAEFAKAKR